MRRRYLVAYDIRDDRRLSRMGRYMRSVAEMLQYSVYLFDGDDEEYVHLIDKIKEIMNEREDSVLVVDLGRVRALDGRSPFRFLGLRPFADGEEAWIL